MSTDTYNIQDNVMSVNEWITELDGEFNALKSIIHYQKILNTVLYNHLWLDYTIHQKPEKSLSEAATGRKLSEETKKKIGNIHRGKITSQETKKKMSENNSRHFSGKKHSPETKKKMSEKAKLRMRNNNGKFTSEKI